MTNVINRHKTVRLFTLLPLGLAAILAACSGDTPTAPQLDNNASLTPSSSAAAMSDLEADGFRVDEVDPSDKEYNGEDGPFEHVIRAPNGVELVFRFAGKIRAREEVSVTLRARSQGQAVDGIVEVDFGDGRRMGEFDIHRKAELTHTYRREGRFRIFAILRADDGMTARGGFRLAIDEPLRVALTGEVVGAAQPKKDTLLRFTAQPINDEARKREVEGTLSVDFGDGETATVKEFDGTATRKHAYATEDTYTVELTLEASGRTFTSSFEVEVTDLPANGDQIDMSQVRSLHAPDIASWPATSTVTGVRINRLSICVYHTKQGSWPAAFSNGVMGNIWVVANIGGQWYAGTTEWVRRGDPCTGQLDGGSYEIAAYTKRPPLSGWRPKKGEVFYMFVSTPARDATRTIDERSNAYRVVW